MWVVACRGKYGRLQSLDIIPTSLIDQYWCVSKARGPKPYLWLPAQSSNKRWKSQRKLFLQCGCGRLVCVNIQWWQSSILGSVVALLLSITPLKQCISLVDCHLPCAASTKTTIAVADTYRQPVSQQTISIYTDKPQHWWTAVYASSIFCWMTGEVIADCHQVRIGPWSPTSLLHQYPRFSVVLDYTLFISVETRHLSQHR